MGWLKALFGYLICRLGWHDEVVLRRHHHYAYAECQRERCDCRTLYAARTPDPHTGHTRIDWNWLSLGEWTPEICTEHAEAERPDDSWLMIVRYDDGRRQQGIAIGSYK